ncbi:MAG: hypothetical protein A4E35_01956 [Methanoregula sp. PtaU1.Bin051]|nr:MAG: hypothetical protein A4E35_01956 [Methanoregula sp. PtaU1.Bin051]
MTPVILPAIVPDEMELAYFNETGASRALPLILARQKG